MQITFSCPACGQRTGTGEIDTAQTSSASEAATEHPHNGVSCPNCDWDRPLTPDELVDGRPGRCLICGNHDLWRQKDFPPGLGLVIVAAGAILSSIAWYFHRPKTAIGTLMAFALADMVVFAVMPDVLVCYRCRARHHGTNPSAEHPAFDHELAERYRQEEIRLSEAERSKTG